MSTFSKLNDKLGVVEAGQGIRNDVVAAANTVKQAATQSFNMFKGYANEVYNRETINPVSQAAAAQDNVLAAQAYNKAGQDNVVHLSKPADPNPAKANVFANDDVSNSNGMSGPR